MASEGQEDVPISVPRPVIISDVVESSVTFCVDTSGSMYNCLHVVKEQLVEALYKHTQHPSGIPLFNIVEFNTQVTQWSDKMVNCTRETVSVASKWIDELSAKTGTNTQDALITAFSDPNCKAVYLITDGLPDQNPEDILDHVVYACGDRPVHCIYLMGEKADGAAIEFLEDLAIETYGSFYVASVTTSGCVEKVTPVYKSDHSNIVQTGHDNILPRSKQCSVTTTLAMDPEESVNSRLASPIVYPYSSPPLHGYRYYHPSYWSRYRPAKGWLKTQDKLLDEAQALELSPAAGALLIGKQVLARRQDDGYFYLGSVQSQIYENKFLIAFGPCKHGKYKNTVYQETMVHDILDYEDSKRRTVLTGDKVLSPWEPEGDRFGPGVVIDGFEKREAEGPDDKMITVSLSNGKTEKVALDTAIWVPEPMYDRLSLELTMPRRTREKMASKPNYPLENLPGYPTSGLIASPQQYPKPVALVLESEVPLDRSFHKYPPYSPVYPIFLKRREKTTKSVVKSEDLNALIPGTHLTTKELEDHVISQLMEHKLLLDERENEKGGRRLLGRREPQDMNSLKKSVSFNDDNLVEMSATPRDYFSPRYGDTDLNSSIRDGCYENRDGQYGRDSGYSTIGSSDKYNQSEYRDMKYKCRDSNISDVDQQFWKATYDKELIDLKNRCTDPMLSDEHREHLKAKFDIEMRDLKYRCRDPNLSESDREFWRGTYNNEMSDIKRRCSDPNLSEGQREHWKVRFDSEMRDQKARCRDPNLSESDRAFWRNAYNNEMREVEYMGRDPSLSAMERDHWKDVYDYELRDIEHRSTDPDLSERERSDWQDLYEYIGNSRDIGVNTDSSLMFYQRPKFSTSSKRPPWKYWKTDPSPPLLDTNTELFEQGTIDGFRETALAAPFEIRTQTQDPYIVEWKSPNFNYVDTFAKHNYSNSNIESVLKPKPPVKNVQTQVQNEYCEVPKSMSKDEITEARRDYRRRKIIQRHIEWQDKISEERNMKNVMQDQYRSRIMEQLNIEREKQMNEQKMIELAREAKKNISAEIRARIEGNQKHEVGREEQRVAAMARQREHREVLQAQRSKELHDITARRQLIREQRSQERSDTITRTLDAEEAHKMTLETKHQNAKVRRMHHFQQLEQNALQKKDFNMRVKEQQNTSQISQIFS